MSVNATFDYLETLADLCHGGYEATANEVAARVGATREAASQALLRLYRSRLVRREWDDDDSCFYFQPTQAGLDALDAEDDDEDDDGEEDTE